MTAANAARGEVIVALAGRPRRLCLTLGALAELESVFRADDWRALATRLASLSASDLAIVLAALLRGETEVDVSAVEVREAAEAVAAAFAAAAR